MSDNIKAQIEQIRADLIFLHEKRDFGRVLFFVTIIGGTLFCYFLLWGWLGIGIFAFVFAVLGIPGLIKWRRAQGKIERLIPQLHALEKQLSINGVVLPLHDGESRFCRACSKVARPSAVFCAHCGKKVD